MSLFIPDSMIGLTVTTCLDLAHLLSITLIGLMTGIKWSDGFPLESGSGSKGGIFLVLDSMNVRL